MDPRRQRRITRTIVAFAAAIPLILILGWLGIDHRWSLLPVSIVLAVQAVQMFVEDTQHKEP